MRFYLPLILTLFSAQILSAADYYWVGTTANGSGDFNTAASWRIGSLSGAAASQSPISTDNVFFVSAGLGTGAVITVNSNANCANMSWDNTITAAQMPTFSGAASVNLDIYGNFSLAQNMNFAFAGKLRFSGTTGLQTVQTRAKKLNLSIFEIKPSAGVEVRLLDSLKIDDPIEDDNNANVAFDLSGGIFKLTSGYFNSNGQYMHSDYFVSNNGVSSRRINFDNSVIVLRSGRVNTVQNSNWELDFGRVAGNYAGFSALNSTIKIEPACVSCTGATNYNFYEFGAAGLPYNDIIFGAGVGYIGLRFSDVSFNNIQVNNGYMYLMDINTPTSNRLQLAAGTGVSTSASASATISLKTEQIDGPTGCGAFAVITEWGAQLQLSKKTAGNLPMNNLVLTGISCNSSSRTYTASNSIDQGGNTGITFSPSSLISRQMRFRDNNGLGSWGHLANWEQWNGTAYVAAVCLPTVVDDVYFDVNSFPTANKELQMNVAGYCRDMRWVNTAASRLAMANNLLIFGTMQLSTAMGSPSVYQSDITGQVMLFGNSNDSLIFNGSNPDLLLLADGSNYTVADAANVGILHMRGRAVINSDGQNIQISNTFQLCGGGTINFNNTQVLFTGNAANVYGGSKLNINSAGNSSTISYNYTGNTTFRFNPSAATAYSAAAGVNLPNVIADKAMYVGTVRILGDLTAFSDMYFTQQQSVNPNNATNTIVQGGMPLYTGSVTFSAGKEYIINDAFTSFNSALTIAGNLNAVGTCNAPITIRNANIGATTSVSIAGSSNLAFCNIQKINKIGTAVSAVNSVDLGGNTNINFSSAGSAKKYFWRAKNGTAANLASHFSGNWNDVTNWSLDSTQTTGQPVTGCLPQAVDTVVFDNLSFLGSSAVTISTGAFCNTFIAKIGYNGIIRTATAGQGTLYVGSNLFIQPNLTNRFNFNGDIIMQGSGSIQTGGTRLKLREFVLNNSAAGWNLLDNFTLSDSTAANQADFGVFRFNAGTFNTNNFTVTIYNRFHTQTSQVRVLNLGNSLINMLNRGDYTVYAGQEKQSWAILNQTNMSINPGNSRIIFGSGNSSPKRFYMGDLSYNRVEFLENNNPFEVRGNANYRYAIFGGNATVLGNNQFDTLELTGGYVWALAAGSVQTLSAPFGTIIPRNVSAGSFVNIETSPVGGSSRIHKEYGFDLCLDFVKVRDNVATRGSSAPAPYDLTLSSLFFNTGSNSDNIGGTATGIWRFTLPPLVTPALAANNMSYCFTDNSVLIPISLTGTSPYIVQGSWVDAAANTGSFNYSFNDDDGNPATAYTGYISATSLVSTSFTANASVYRCGTTFSSSPASFAVSVPSPSVLSAANGQGSCVLSNKKVFVDFYDNSSSRPIASVQDSTSSSDLQSLGNTTAYLNLDPALSNCNGNVLGIRPRLPRYWQITPSNNGAANVRLYFTQSELNQLILPTYIGQYSGQISPTDLELWKFNDGQLCNATPTVLPFTVVNMSAATAGYPNAKAFSSTAGLIAIECAVSSFSHFVLVPKSTALLATDFIQFEAKAEAQTVRLDWRVAQNEQVAYFIVQRSSNGVDFEDIGQVAAQELRGQASYQSADLNPNGRILYYRIVQIDQQAQRKNSLIRSVNLDNPQQWVLYPNPAQQAANLGFVAEQQETINVQIINQLGQVVQQQHFETQLGANTLRLDLSSLSKGLYLCRASGQQILFSQPFVIE